MNDAAQSAKKRIFFSYTGDLRDEASVFHEAPENGLGADVHSIDDWLITPQMAGSLWEGLHDQIDNSDVFVALICERYGKSIGGKEAEYLRDVWGQKRRLFVPILFCPKASEWWSEFTNDERTPQAFRDITWHELHSGGEPNPFFMVGRHQKAMLRPDVKSFIRRLSETIGHKLCEWDSQPAEKEVSTPTDEPSVYVFGGMEWALPEDASTARDDLLAAVNATIGDKIVNVGDEWGKALIRAKNAPLFDKRGSGVAHVVAIGDKKLRDEFLAEQKEVGERLILDEINQNVEQSAPSVAQVAKRYLWMPSYSEEEVAAANHDGARFEYHGGSADQMANTIQGLFGRSQGAELLLEHSGKFKRVQDFAKSKLPPNLEIEASSEVFTGAPAMKSLLKSGSPSVKRPIIVAIGDKSVRAHTSNSRELNNFFRNHLREYENQIDELEIDNDEQRIFRVFLQYQHTLEASAQHEVNDRVWEVLRFVDPRRGEPCPNSLFDLSETFKDWYGEHWSGAELSASGA